jgi:hypothetical protein
MEAAQDDQIQKRSEMLCRLAAVSHGPTSLLSYRLLWSVLFALQT